MDARYSQSWFLSAGEVNAQGELSLPLLTQKIIDVATGHANSLGIGNPSMQSLGCGWVLSRLSLEMERYPRVNRSYTLTTWVESWNRHFSVRNFMISDEKGEPVGYASSVWMVLNYKTRENAGLSHLSLAPDMVSGQKVPIGKAPRGGERALEHVDRKYTFRYCDLDFYRHVNTVRYIELLLNSFTLEEMDHNRVRRMDLAFMHEGHYGETVEVLMEKTDGKAQFALRSESDQTILLAATMQFNPLADEEY